MRQDEIRVHQRSEPLCRVLLPVLIMTLVGTGRQYATAASPDPVASTREIREAAIQAIPFDKLNEQSQTRLRNVVNNPTLHRRLPVQKIDCNPELYLFLLRNPEVVVGMWQVMGITNISLKRTGPYTYDTRDGMGITSNVELVYGTPEIHVMYGEGVYEGPLLKHKTSGRCVMVLKSEYTRNKERTIVSNQLDVFLQMDNVGADLVAKTLHPLLGKTADHNFAETTTFVSRVSQAIERSGGGVDRLATRLKDVDPAVRQQFVAIANRMHQEAVAREIADDLRPPLSDQILQR